MNAPSVDVIHADDHLLVLNKPAGLLCVPGRGEDKQDCLSSRVQQVYPEALVVHRLDMATSGLLLMARSADMQRRLGKAFEERHVHKRYVAVVDGRPDPRFADADGWSTIHLPIIVDWPRRPLRMIDAERGKPSVTRWRIHRSDNLPRDPGGPGRDDGSLPATRLDLEPVTGRSHQLRVHLLATGHPILGDQLYAGPAVQARAARLLLHACRLAFTHPATGQAVRFESPPPF